jgi:hypothetical protein
VTAGDRRRAGPSESGVTSHRGTVTGTAMVGQPWSQPRRDCPDSWNGTVPHRHRNASGTRAAGHAGPRPAAAAPGPASAGGRRGERRRHSAGTT